MTLTNARKIVTVLHPKLPSKVCKLIRNRKSYQISSVHYNAQGKQFTYCGYKVERTRRG